MPRITAGGPSALPNDELVTRVDITPLDVTTATDEQLHELLAKLRRDRETAAPRKSKTSSRKSPSEPTEPINDDLEDI